MAKVISTDKAPAAVGPYSQALMAGNILFASGQIPLNPATGEIVGDTAAEQAVQVFGNIKEVLKEAGMSVKDVVKTTVFLTDLSEFAAVNAVYAEHFSEPFPARSCVEVGALPKGARIECEIIAVKSE
ncbi:MAG: RidA family protein [Solobacterium sp.]|nr:RidA family protein [Solobacterium sp.]MBR2768834.1 RidA family protein [Solobacterium sp.]